MSRKYTTSKHLDRVLEKLMKKDRQLYGNVLNKIDEVINSPDIEHYKNLRYDLKAFKRVHVGSFVLVFRYDVQNDFVYFEDFDHHDNIYRK